jgi:hypothetical protein
VPLKNGTLQRTSYNPGIHPLQNQYVSGPMLWNMSASAFKTVQIKEQVFVRFNVDFLDNRVLQMTLRVSW